MLPYWILFGIFAAGSLFYRPWERHGRRATALLVAMLLLALFVGLRYRVGVDWSGYSIIFRRTATDSWALMSSYGDPAFYGLVWIAHRLNLGIWAVNMVCATIFAIGLFSFARRQPNPWLVVAVAVPYLVIVVAMSGTRQATAIGLLLLALGPYAEGKLGKAALWIILGAMFHASAILMLGVLAMSYSRNRLTAAVILAVTVAATFYVLSSSFEIYVSRYSNTRLQSSGTVFRVAMNVLPAIIYLAQPRNFRAVEHEHSLWRNMAVLAIICAPAVVFVPSSTAIDRLSLYIIPLQLYVLGRLPVAYSRTRQQYYILVGLVLGYLALAMFVFFAFSVHGRYWKPYKAVPFERGAMERGSIRRL